MATAAMHARIMYLFLLPSCIVVLGGKCNHIILDSIDINVINSSNLVP